MEHVRVVTESEEMTHGISFLGGKKGIEISCAIRCIDPFLGGAVRGITIIIDTGGPSRVYLETSEAVCTNSADKRPVGVLLVSQDGTGVISNAVCEAIVHPRSQSISVMKASNSRWHKPICCKAVGGRDASTIQPDDIE